MNIEIAGFWTKIRKKGFVIYLLAVASLMMMILFLIDLIINGYFYEEPFEWKNSLWWDIPINLILSVSVAISYWYYGGKRLKLESDIIEMNLNENDGKKEK